MANGPKFGRPGKPPKLPVRLNAKPTRPHKVRRGELLDDLRRREALQSPLFCQHANECPAVCPCRGECWCNQPGRMCSST